MKKTDFDTLTFDAAMRLYGLKLQAEKNNDIQLRTKLLRDHPALFDKETLKLFEATAENIRRYQLRKHQQSKNKNSISTNDRNF